MPERTFTQYRIVARKSGERRFVFLPFTGASSGDLERITKRLAGLPAESPGYEYRLQQRTVTVVETQWRTVT